MYIVGITGPIDSGKTTFADYLGDNFRTHTHLESSDLIMEVANDLRAANATKKWPTIADVPLINDWLMPLPDILKTRTHADSTFDIFEITEEKVTAEPELYTKLAEYFTHMQAHPELQSGYITVDNKDDHRAILQWLGGFVTKKVRPTIWYKELMRRAHEEPQSDMVTVGGLRFTGDADTIRASEGRVIAMVRPNTIAQDSSDVTERERNLIRPDITINNDGTLDQLKACATQLSKDLQSNGVKASYNAVNF